MLYTVSEMAKRLGVAPSTLRYYDKEGLLPFIERSDGGIRMFKDTDFEWLSIIECLKKTGMPIKEMKVFIDWCIEGDTTISKRKELIEKQRQVVLFQIQQLKETLSMLDYKKWYYETAEKAGSCKVHETMQEDDVPDNLRHCARRAGRRCQIRSCGPDHGYPRRFDHASCTGGNHRPGDAVRPPGRKRIVYPAPDLFPGYHRVRLPEPYDPPPR